MELDYGSDSEEEEKKDFEAPSAPQAPPPIPPAKQEPPHEQPTKPFIPASDTIVVPAKEPEQPPSNDAPIVGPQRPPTASPEPEDDEDPANPPLSPYSLERTLVHNLTLPPTIPAIPPSPPGSPPPPLSAKFSHFRDLKSNGVHFNEKLLRSSSLRNPNLLQKLTAFVGFDEMDQYATNLSKDVWDPKGFKKDEFVEELAKKQAARAEKRERARLEGAREKVEFVGSVQTPPAQQPRERVAESAAERVMKGLDRESRAAPPPPSRDRGSRRSSRWDEGDRRRDDDRDRRRDDGRGRRRDEDRDRRRDGDSWDRKRNRTRSRPRDRERDRVDRRHKDVEYCDRK
ncbi:HCNGP-like protein-domain-containing protein [Sphaerosporella brunnea]|uniref:HCNGP-like protein-domain-containing protein n=1 Tax=Sphaerosporella brunnea TaxID=1250544 RepID=A0A5J5EWI2_9PEZI|nr:HCNGP-like protein-domain-containing protein [Sphaerosporella brunnea]